MKKLLALILAMSCVLSLCAVSVSASTSIIDQVVDSDGKPVYSATNDTIRPGSEYFYVIGTSADYDNLTDRDLIKFTMKKKTNGKYISDADITEKKFGGIHYVCIQFSIKDNFTADEYKVEMEAQFRARKDLIANILPGSKFPKLTLAPSGSTGNLAAAETELGKLKTVLTTATTAFDTAKNNLTAVDVAGKPYWSSVNYSTVTAATLDTLLAGWVADTSLTDQVTAKTSERDAAIASLVTINNQISTLSATLKSAETAVVTATATDKANQERLAALKTINTTAYDNALAGNDATATKTEWGKLSDAIVVYRTAYPTTTITALPLFNDSDSTPNATALAALKVQLADTTDTEFKTVNDAATKSAADLVTATNEKNVANTNYTNYTTGNGAGTVDKIKALEKTRDDAQAFIDNSKRIRSATTTKQEVTNLVNDLKTKMTAVPVANAAVIAQQAVVDALKKVGGGSTQGLLKSGETYPVPFKLWIQNEKITDSDATFVAGEKGVVIRPVKNERNTITWEKSDGELARVEFMANSDSSFFCPRLSTSWNKMDFRDYFDQTDAHVYDFSDQPTLPCTSQATLTFFNPFVNEDGELTTRKNRIHVYQVDKDGELTDKTRQFTIGENDDGDFVLTTRTRTLGTYIISDGKADIPEKKPTPPVVDRPAIDINGNTKPIPNTGR